MSYVHVYQNILDYFIINKITNYALYRVYTNRMRVNVIFSLDEKTFVDVPLKLSYAWAANHHCGVRQPYVYRQ